MSDFMDKIPLPANWDDPLIRSCAAFLDLAEQDMELSPELFQKAQARLGWAAMELKMGPDQLQRAMSQSG